MILSPRRREGAGVGFLTENPRRKGSPGRGGGGGARGLEGVCEELGGGAKYFLSGPKCPPRKIRRDFRRVWM